MDSFFLHDNLNIIKNDWIKLRDDEIHGQALKLI